MSKSEKLIKRFKTVPKDLTWDEFVKIMAFHGYRVSNGKNGGSSRRFFNEEQGLTLTFHEPHPKSIVKRYCIREVIKHFDDNKVWK